LKSSEAKLAGMSPFAASIASPRDCSWAFHISRFISRRLRGETSFASIFA
jgi:hypothetical protein